MWQNHKLVVQSADQPCFGALQTLAADAAGHRCRAYGLLYGTRPESRTDQVQGLVFSRKYLWLSQDGVYIFLPGHLPDITGLRWLVFSKEPLVRSGMTSGAMSSIRFIRIQWRSHRSEWLVSFHCPRPAVTSRRKYVFFPHDQER